MLGKTHLLYGMTAGAVAALALLHPERPLGLTESILAGGVGGLLPDLDEPGATISNAPRILGGMARRMVRRATGRTPLRVLGLLLAALVRLAAAVLNVLSRLISRIARFVSGGHREGTHWLPVWALLSIGVFLLTAPLAVAAGGPYVGLGFCVGYLSHLAGDGCTRSGIPLVPRTGVRLHLLPRLLRVRTGTAGETVATAAYVLLLGAIVYELWSHRLVALVM